MNHRLERGAGLGLGQDGARVKHPLQPPRAPASLLTALPPEVHLPSSSRGSRSVRGHGDREEGPAGEKEPEKYEEEEGSRKKTCETLDQQVGGATPSKTAPCSPVHSLGVLREASVPAG